MVDALTDVQLRVIGSLVEKEATVPDTYPMTLKGLQTACNQKNNREPVTDLEAHVVQRALDELKALGLVRFVHASHGARTTKYRHVLDERLRLSPGELALLAVLFLRGPQTLNELRTRTERAHSFDDADQVEATLEDLADRDDPLVVHLARQPGQKETRWMHLVGGPVDADELFEPVPSPPAGAPRQPVAPATAAPAGTPALETRVAELEQRVAALEALLTDPAVPGGGAGMPPSGNDDFQSADDSVGQQPRENS